jgi:hypothetical protein
VDNDTSRGIKGAYFIVLNPGVTYAQWEKKNFPDSMIFTYAQADSRGEFVLPDLLQYGVGYTVVVLAEGYSGQFFEDTTYGPQDGSEFYYTIPLTQR